ncbi:alpha/beta fold hydrolase [Jatrophihabitans sp. DSM 45814]
MTDSVVAEHDEWATLPDLFADLGVPPSEAPSVARRDIEVSNGQKVSGIFWGTGDPEIVFLHGGGQNAHTWDVVAVTLGRPAVALDLPGHGHSDWREDNDYSPFQNAEAISSAFEVVAPAGAAVVGMSLGGLTTIRLAAKRPDLVQRALIVDVTPGVLTNTAKMTTEDRGTTALTAGSEFFPSLDKMVEITAQASPGRTVEAVRRGVLNNARQLPDGRWRWRYDIAGMQAGGMRARDPKDWNPLWEDLESLNIPVTLVRGGDSKFVSDKDVEEFLRRRPGARTEVVPGAGHAVQTAQPAKLAALIESFLQA